MSPRADIEALVADAWPRAQARWSSFLVMGAPVVGAALPSIAQIHLGTREVSLDAALIAEHGLHDCVEALLAHEVGHHVRYPATLAADARLRLLERSLIPFPGVSLVNLFTDLMINEQLGAAYAPQFVRVYRAIVPMERWKEGPSFLFYLMVYEELWGLAPGAILGDHAGPFADTFPGVRADAQLLAQELFHLGPNLYTQFLYFASVVSRYLPPVERPEPVMIGPGSCSSGEPSAGDWADALTLSPQEREAIARALRDGWIDADNADRLGGRGAFDRRVAGLPGQGTADARAVPEVMAAYYRQQAERHLIRVPTRRVLGDALVPTSVDDWEPGDPVRAIDWLATLQQRGSVYGASLPLKRETVADDEGLEVPSLVPRVEIYLDVSGSMPNPVRCLNAMTLAAQVLAMGALRAQGAVRALLFSTGTTEYWSWCRSEAEISRFLMHYIGGGTVFPFHRLADSVQQCGDQQPHRVFITDRDFDACYDGDPSYAVTFGEAATKSPQLVLLLHQPNEAKTKRYERAGATVVPVADLEDFPKMAGALARALFGERA
ncbi:MAG: hypothetical protein JWM10_4897 [Myxococcaceae bacterium]|nr:hypothetical protein [Myxococcaceae bacterium]